MSQSFWKTSVLLHDRFSQISVASWILFGFSEGSFDSGVLLGAVDGRHTFSNTREITSELGSRPITNMLSSWDQPQFLEVRTVTERDFPEFFRALDSQDQHERPECFPRSSFLTCRIAGWPQMHHGAARLNNLLAVC